MDLKLIILGSILAFQFPFFSLISGFDLSAVNEETEGFEEDDSDDATDPGVVFKQYSTNKGRVNLPWLTLPSMRRPVPICYDLSPDGYENTVRLAHLLCRHTGAMIATKWSAKSKAMLGLNTTGLSISLHCRGDEQLLAGCRWNKPSLIPCSDLLSVDCGECTNSLMLRNDDSEIIHSPGFPFYIPLVTCQWNITLEPQSNVLLRFKEFDLPNPTYSEDSDSLNCQFGSLDILLFHEELGKFIVEGRFCGRHSPGKFTILSSQILLRYVAGAFNPEVMTKKGFLVECSALPTPPVQVTTLSYEDRVIRWVLITILTVLLLTLLILAWACKHRIEESWSRQFRAWRSRNLRRVQGVDLEDDVFTPAASNVELLQSSTRIRISPPRQRSSVRSGRRRNWSSTVIRSQMIHMKKMEQLQQQSNARRSTSYQPSTSQRVGPDESHVYEEIGHVIQTRSESLPVPSSRGSRSNSSQRVSKTSASFLSTPSYTRRVSSRNHYSDSNSQAQEERPSFPIVLEEPRRNLNSGQVRVTATLQVHDAELTNSRRRQPLSSHVISQSSSESSANATYIDPNYGTSPSPDESQS